MSEIKHEDVDYKSCYCPEGLDATLPENWIRKNYVIPFQANTKPPYPSDSDLYTVVSKIPIGDFELDYFDLGVYLRLQLFEYFGYAWYSIFEFGDEKVIENSLNKLYKKKYIYQLQDGTVKVRNL